MFVENLRNMLSKVNMLRLNLAPLGKSVKRKLLDKNAQIRDIDELLIEEGSGQEGHHAEYCSLVAADD